MTNCNTQCADTQRSRNAAWLPFAGLAWAGVLLVGILMLLRHDFTAGQSSGKVPERWPNDTALVKRPGLPTLVMAVHPNCPCSRASVEQLERIASQGEHPVQFIALFFDSPDLESCATWKSIANNSAIQVVVDKHGRLAERFGAITSGEALLYDAEGLLRFHGGLTPSRGHSGPGRGVDAVLGLAAGQKVACSSAPAFGCSLLEVN